MFPKRNVKKIYILAFAAILKSFQSLAAMDEPKQKDSCECSRAYVDIPYLFWWVRPSTRNVDEDMSTFFF